MELWAEANERLLRRGKDKSNNGDKREDDRGSGNRNVNALHVVSAWSREVGICFGGEKESADYECGVI
jgi:hypothetical protein